MCLGEWNEIEQKGCHGFLPLETYTEYPEMRPFPVEWNSYGQQLQQSFHPDSYDLGDFQNVSYSPVDFPRSDDLADSPSSQNGIYDLGNHASLQNVGYDLRDPASFQTMSYTLVDSPSYQNVSYDLGDSPTYQTGSYFVSGESQYEPFVFPRQTVQLENRPTGLGWNLSYSNEGSNPSPDSKDPVSGSIQSSSLDESPSRAKVKGYQRPKRNHSGDSFPTFHPDVTPWDERVKKVTEFRFGRPEWTVAVERNQSLFNGLLKGRFQTFVTGILQACLGNDLSGYNLTGTSYVQRISRHPVTHKIQGKKLAIPLELLGGLISLFESILPQSYLNGLSPSSSVEKMVRRMISRACSRNTEAKNRRKSKQ